MRCLVQPPSDLPNNFVGGYRHHARLNCPSCNGLGCGWCRGTGSAEVGCGGAVEADRNHPGMVYCFGCQVLIKPDEVSFNSG